MKRLLLLLILAHMGALANNLVVHEWGTFTSLMGSDGTRLEGMHQEEASLPNFVYGFGKPQAERPVSSQGRCGHIKLPCATLNNLASTAQPAEVIPKNPLGAGITQKMETPVIYFYGDVGQKVDVAIGFPQGLISQYYPKATSYSPLFNDVSTLGPSQFSFNVELLSPDANEHLPKTVSDSIWNPSRMVKANTILAHGEQEKFIFYRGVGDFDAKITVKNDGQRVIIQNRSKEPIHRAFILNFDGNKGVIRDLGSIKDLQEAPIPNSQLPKDAYIAMAKELIAQALIKDGLYADEAHALVNTWEKSYFLTPGIRVLYLVPEGETNAIIPLTINPVPSQLVRVLVGRVEVMSKHEEDMLVQKLMKNPSLDVRASLGHYAEPKLRRVLNILQTKPSPAKKPVIKAVKSLISKIN
jgi:hypothetical protein